MREDFTLNFWLRAKIQKEANFYICRFQIINQLNLMLHGQMSDSLKFKYYRVISYDICFVISNRLILIIDGNFRMSDTRDSSFLKFSVQGILIYVFYKSIP